MTALLYALCLLLLAAMLPVDGSVRVPEAAAALVIFALVGVALACGDRVLRHRAATYSGIIAFVIAVGLMRNAAGIAIGYGVLVLLPVIWSALRGRVDEIALSIGAGVTLFFVPIVFAIDSVRYPSYAWRAACLVLLVATLVGVAVLRLVRRLSTHSEQSAAIIDTMTEGFTLTRNGRIVTVNRALCELTGFSQEQLIGSLVPYPFIPPESFGHFGAERSRIIDGGVGGELEITLMRADGSRFDASLTIAPARLESDGIAFVSTYRDITERKAHEHGMHQRARELAVIAHVTRTVGHSDRESARRTICQVALEVTGASSATVWELTGTEELLNTCTLGAPHPHTRLRADAHQSGAVRAWQTSTPVFIADVPAGERTYEPNGTASVHFQPIVGVNGVRGVLALSWSDPVAALPLEVVPLLEVLADEAATALERGDLLRQLEELARTDELTGLPNRRAWEELFDRELRMARRTGGDLSVAMLDLDFFKTYNDQHGHVAGDRLLRTAASRWHTGLRDTDVLARWGGDEFGLLLPSCDAVACEQLIERLRGLLPDGMTVSIGHATWDGRSSAQALLKAADGALYAAKAAGRNQAASAPLPA